MATTILFSILVLLGAMLHQTSGCTCVKTLGFCGSDFAIRGTIIDIQGNLTMQSQEDVMYSVQVEQVYRNTSDGIAVNETIDIEAPGHTCEVGPLEDGKTYLISGVYSYSYSVDVCNSVVIEYNDPDDAEDLGIPCSASLTTITSYVAIVCALLHLILH